MSWKISLKNILKIINCSFYLLYRNPMKQTSRVYEYKNNCLIHIYKDWEISDSMKQKCIAWHPDWKFWNINDFHCADEYDWQESQCCSAIIRLGRCSECKEYC